MKPARRAHSRKSLGLVWPLLALLALATTIPSLSSCFMTAGGPVQEAEGPSGHAETAVSEVPPPLQHEEIVGEAPSPNHVWAHGYWNRQHDGWHWVEGHWSTRPHRDAVWVEGRWDRQPRGYTWVSGYWR